MTTMARHVRAIFLLNVLGRVDVLRLDFVRSGKHVLAKRGMKCSYSTQMTSGSYDRK